MPVRRDLRPLLAVALLGVVLAAAESISGLGTGALLLSPALVLVLPLLAGHYLGEETLERLAGRAAAPRRRRPTFAAQLPRRRPRANPARGGRLIAAALAERGPPVTAA
jgi:hypothetical protein